MANGEFSAPGGGLWLLGVPPAPLTNSLIVGVTDYRTIGLDQGAWVETKRGEKQVFSDTEEIETKESLTGVLSGFPHAFTLQSRRRVCRGFRGRACYQHCVKKC